MLPVSERAMKQITEHTTVDPELSLIKQYIMHGWPSRKACDVLAKPYFNVSHELYIVNNVIFKGNCIVVPKSLRKGMLQQIHTGHLGEAKCKARARGILYWPGMSSYISNISLLV